MSKEENTSSLFTAISNCDVVHLKALLSTDCGSVNCFDDDKMTPIQHAAYRGHKEMVQLLLDHGADVNLCEHQHKYTALHFAGLSGNTDVCLLLLMAGAMVDVKNTVNRTPAQMAAFVGNHNCAVVCNNFIPRILIEQHCSDHLPPVLIDSLHRFCLENNLNPVKIVINLFYTYSGLGAHLETVKSILTTIYKTSYEKHELNEILIFKLYYFSYVLNELQSIQRRQQLDTVGDDYKKMDACEIFTRKILKPIKAKHNVDFMDTVLKDCIREFPYRETNLIQQIVGAISGPENNTNNALIIITNAVNGVRPFSDSHTVCDTCGDEKPTKKCSKCKAVQYCGRNCQRLHWHWHKAQCKNAQKLNKSKSPVQ